MAVTAHPYAEGRPSRSGRFTAAALLPAGLVSAVLVAAPFAGTTTHALSADTRPAAVAPVTTSATAVSSTAVTTDRPPAIQPASGSQDANQISITVPAYSLRNLVIAYVLIAALGATVIITTAVRSAHYRR